MQKLSIEEHLVQHLTQWGLREFFREEDYYAWQRNTLDPKVLTRLHELAEKRQGGLDAASDRDFYDLASSSTILPVLYSQRFGYFRAVGTAISQSLQPGRSVLDFGCGVGILTTWYAVLFPDCRFTGIDRSARSIAVAQQQADRLQLDNVSFHTCSVPHEIFPGVFDVVISTQTLFQSETEPGIPSRSWKSFDRDADPERQRWYEHRTGIGDRLDWLLARVHPMGRVLVFEKATHLGRRVLFQRALSARGLSCECEPVWLSYTSLDEHLVDGPLYTLTQQPTKIGFNEAPYCDPQERLYRCQGKAADLVWSIFSTLGSRDEPMQSWFGEQEIQWELCRMGAGLLGGRVTVPDVFTGLLIGAREDEEMVLSLIEELLHPDTPDTPLEDVLRHMWSGEESSDLHATPLYENHSASAQEIWKRLSDRVVYREINREGSQGQQFHAELGGCAGSLVYVYWANTFDQRQIVVMEAERKHVLEEYFSEAGFNE